MEMIKTVISEVVKHLINNKDTYLKVGAGMAVSSAITLIACNRAHRKLESKHRKEDAERYKAEFDRQAKALEERYKHNEAVLKQKLNDLCDQFGIGRVF